MERRSAAAEPVHLGKAAARRGVGAHRQQIRGAAVGRGANVAQSPAGDCARHGSQPGRRLVVLLVRKCGGACAHRVRARWASEQAAAMHKAQMPPPVVRVTASCTKPKSNQSGHQIESSGPEQKCSGTDIWGPLRHRVKLASNHLSLFCSLKMNILLYLVSISK